MNKNEINVQNLQTKNDPVYGYDFIPELKVASGPLDITMLIDYVFRGIFQKNTKALQGLVSSLLHIPSNEIIAVNVVNSNMIGYSADNKEYRLDLNVRLNDGILINIEMEMIFKKYWKNRSLAYLCRDFDNLARGGSYSDIKPVVHIVIHNDAPTYIGDRFYSVYKLMEEKTYKIFNDNFSLNVLNLKKVDNATEEDKAWGIDHWAKLLTSRTWEDVRMHAKNDEFLTETANTFFLFSADAIARKKALEREDFLRQQYYDALEKKKLEDNLAEKDNALAEKNALIEKLLAENAALKSNK